MKNVLLLILLCASLGVYADGREKTALKKSYFYGLEYRIKGGFNFGGTSPLPLPAEIRKIEGFRPGLQIAIEGNVIKWIDTQKKWGTLIGIRLESKGMKTDAKVKNYYMVMDATEGDQTGHMEGNWTGYVKTDVKNSFLTVPIQVIHKLSPRWDIKFGPYLSYLTDGEFSGSAYDGYLREGNPTGTKVNVTEATYDFSSDLRKFQWGIDVGGEWRAYRHLSIYADLTWGLNAAFPKDFKSISFKMYNIYLNFGFGYVF